MPRPRLFLIDTFGFLFRTFHARAFRRATQADLLRHSTRDGVHLQRHAQEAAQGPPAGLIPDANAF